MKMIDALRFAGMLLLLGVLDEAMFRLTDWQVDTAVTAVFAGAYAVVAAIRETAENRRVYGR